MSRNGRSVKSAKGEPSVSNRNQHFVDDDDDDDDNDRQCIQSSGWESYTPKHTHQFHPSMKKVQLFPLHLITTELRLNYLMPKRTKCTIERKGRTRRCFSYTSIGVYNTYLPFKRDQYTSCGYFVTPKIVKSSNFFV